MTYIDAWAAAVADDNRQNFTDHSRAMAKIIRECGALDSVDCWGDDVPDGKQTSFRKAVQCGEGETVVFGWIVWPSKTARDKGMKEMRRRFGELTTPMPFDGKRLIFGGFEKIGDL